MKQLNLLFYRSVRLAVFCTILSALLEVAVSYSLTFLVVKNRFALLQSVLMVLGLYFLQAVAMYFQMKTKGVATYYLSQDIKQKIDKWFSTLPYQRFHQKDHGEWLSLYVNDVNKVMDLTLNKFLSMVEKTAVACFVLLALFWIHYSMSILALASLLVMLLIPRVFQSHLSRHILRVQDEKETYLSKVRELLQGFDTFLENTAFSIFLRKSRLAAESFSKAVFEADRFTAVMSACLTFTNAFVTVIALGLLSYNVMEGRVGAGAFLSVSSLLPSFGAAVMEVLSEREFYKSGHELYSLKFSMLESVDREPFFEKSVGIHNIPIPEVVASKIVPLSSDIVLQEIVVHYPNKSISLPQKIQFKKGHKYAIIGESGSGKSSLFKVLTGEWLDYHGLSQIDGKPVSSPVFDRLSYVNQNTFLFNDTVRNNIDLLGEHSDNELKSMLLKMHLGDLSLDAQIEDNGRNLSGGQRQRLSLARALLRGRSVLLLDEATANLDKELSESIERELLTLNLTVIMISHHLSDEVSKYLDDIVKLE